MTLSAGDGQKSKKEFILFIRNTPVLFELSYKSIHLLLVKNFKNLLRLREYYDVYTL